MSFHDCDLDLREAERGEALRRKHELAALGKAVTRELAALNAKIDRLSEMLGVPAEVPKAASEPLRPLRQKDFAKRVGISPSALWKLLKEGKVEVTVDRRIPERELRKFGL